MSPEILLLAALVFAILLTEFCRFLRVPRAVGQVSAGVLLSLVLPTYLISAENNAAMGLLSSVGVFMLFFFVGLEINMRDIRHNVKAGLIISLFNTLIPLIAAILLMPLLGFDFQTSIIIGICLAVSSQAFGIDLLEQFGLLKTRVGKLIVTAGAVDDLLEFGLIALVLTLIESSVEQQTPLELAGGFVLYMLAVVGFQYYVLPYFLRMLEREKSNSNLLLGSIAVLMLIALLGELVGIGPLIGAFTAGILIRHVLLTGKNRKPWEELRIAHNVRIVAFGFFVPVFFVWTGYNSNLLTVIEHPTFVLVATIIAFVGTIGGTLIGSYITGHTAREAWLTGWAVNAKGDTELAIATTALAAGAITRDVFSGLIVMSILSTLISPIVFRALLKHHAKRPLPA